MPIIQRPSLSRTMLQMELAKFYDKPVAKVSVGLILSILTIIFFAYAAIRPTLQTMADLIKQIEEKRDVDQKLTVKINALGIAQKELTEKEPLGDILTIAIPSSPEFPVLLKAFEKLAAEQGVLFVSLQTSEVPPELSASRSAQLPTGLSPTLESVPFTAAFSAEYTQLSTFLKALQNLQRIIVIDQFEFVTSANQKDKNLTLTVAGRAFFFNAEKKAKPKVAAQVAPEE